jgi:hypothetical protein
VVGVFHEALKSRCHSGTVTTNLGHTENEATVSLMYEYKNINLSFFVLTRISTRILITSYFLSSETNSNKTITNPNAAIHRNMLCVVPHDMNMIYNDFAVLIHGHMSADLFAEL